MAERGYDQMSASEVIADLHGEGYQNPDTGEIWDGEKYIPPGEGVVIDTDLTQKGQADEAKKRAKDDYLKVFKNRVESKMRELQEARDDLDTAIKDLEQAEANAKRWYGDA